MLEEKMPENLKELLRKVFSVDTRAGERLRYHITRSLACEDYGRKIHFDKTARGLPELFMWEFTPEDWMYWNWINEMINPSINDSGEPLDIPF